jgi:hypothetical protein
MRLAGLTFIVTLACAQFSAAAPKPVPASPYLPVVYRYADAMLKHGRDAVGPQKTGLLLSALDRKTLAPPDERPLADPRSDQNLLRVLYTLSELSTKPVYRDAADAELKWMLENEALSEGGLAAWDGGVAWDVRTDLPVNAGAAGEAARAWMLWDRCFELSPSASKQRVLALQQAAARKPPPSPRET